MASDRKETPLLWLILILLFLFDQPNYGFDASLDVFHRPARLCCRKEVKATWAFLTEPFIWCIESLSVSSSVNSFIFIHWHLRIIELLSTVDCFIIAKFLNFLIYLCDSFFYHYFKSNGNKSRALRLNYTIRAQRFEKKKSLLWRKFVQHE